MLNLIRDNVQSFGVKFIVGIVVIVMSFFGISAYRSQSSNTLVTIDGYEVKLESFQRAYENAREDIRRRYGAQASNYLNMINLEAQVLRQLTSNALLLKSAEDNGLAVSDKELAHEIYNNPAFMTDNRFDAQKYDQNLSNLRTDKIGFEKNLKESLLSQKYLRFVGTGALISRNSLEEELRRYESVMTINVIDFDPTLFEDQAKVSEEQIKAYYDLHKSDFQQKSQFKLNYFVLSIDDVKDKVNVREREVTRYYENNVTEEFTEKPSFHSRHILISTPQDNNPEATALAKQKADSIYQQLSKNRSQFATLATIHSQDPGSAKKGGDLGWVEEGSFVAEFETAVSNLKKNEISQPFQSNFGYHIVELIDRKPARVKPFEEVKTEIEESIRANKAKRRMSNQVTKMVNDSALQTLEEMAQSINKTIAQTEEFDETKQIKDIGSTFQLYQELSEKTVGQKGQFKLAGDQKTLVYEIAEIKEPFVKPLGEVKELVRYYAREELKVDLAKQKLDAFAETVSSTDQLENIAKELKTKVVPITFKYSDRKLGELNVSEKFKSEVFKLKNNEVKGITDSNRGYLVYMVDKKKGELGDNNREILARLENLLRNQKSQVVLNGLINKLQSEIEVNYNMQLLTALNVKLES